MNAEYYKLLNQTETEEKLNYQIQLNANHPVYGGHFPGQPVMPGVVQVEIVSDLISNTLGEQLLLKRARRIKFLNIIDPNLLKQMKISIAYKKIDEGYKITAVGAMEDKYYFKIDGIFGEY